MLKLAIKSFLIINNWYYLCQYLDAIKLAISWSHFLSLITDIISTNILMLKVAIKSFLIFNNWYYLCQYLDAKTCKIIDAKTDVINSKTFFISYFNNWYYLHKYFDAKTLLIVKVAKVKKSLSLLTDVISQIYWC